MLPFNSRTKWMLTVHSFDAAAPATGGQGLTGGYLMYMKGAWLSLALPCPICPNAHAC